MNCSLISNYAGHLDLAVTPGTGMVTALAQWIRILVEFVALQIAGI